MPSAGRYKQRIQRSLTETFLNTHLTSFIIIYYFYLYDINILDQANTDREAVHFSCAFFLSFYDMYLFGEVITNVNVLCVKCLSTDYTIKMIIIGILFEREESEMCFI